MFRLRTLRLSDNNLICDCQLSWLARFLRHSPRLNHATRCFSPNHLKGQNVADLHDQEFKCSGQYTRCTAVCTRKRIYCLLSDTQDQWNALTAASVSTNHSVHIHADVPTESWTVERKRSPKYRITCRTASLSCEQYGRVSIDGGPFQRQRFALAFVVSHGVVQYRTAAGVNSKRVFATYMAHRPWACGVWQSRHTQHIIFVSQGLLLAIVQRAPRLN